METSPNRNSAVGIDPDPIAILAICFAGVAMLSGVANTVIQVVESRRSGRVERRAELDRVGELLITRDHLFSTGHQLRQSIEAFRRNARLAISFDVHGTSSDARFTYGSLHVSVTGTSREMWELLVDDVCTNVKLINRLVLDYNTHLEELFTKLRLLQAASPDKWEFFERYVYVAREQVSTFQSALVKFQSFTSKTPLNRVVVAFNDLCDQAERLVAQVGELTFELTRRLR